MYGDRLQVLQQAVKSASACEDGGLQPYGRRCIPENYIRRIRGLLDEAAATPARGGWRARLDAPLEHPAVAALRELGLEPHLETRCGATYAIVEPAHEHHAMYFQLVDRYVADLPAWHWFEIFGLPAS
jgi:hypothetical protein